MTIVCYYLKIMLDSYWYFTVWGCYCLFDWYFALWYSVSILNVGSPYSAVLSTNCNAYSPNLIVLSINLIVDSTHWVAY